MLVLVNFVSVSIEILMEGDNGTLLKQRTHIFTLRIIRNAVSVDDILWILSPYTSWHVLLEFIRLSSKFPSANKHEQNGSPLSLWRTGVLARNATRTISSHVHDVSWRVMTQISFMKLQWIFFYNYHNEYFALSTRCFHCLTNILMAGTKILQLNTLRSLKSFNR
jgi:hypothetical protein